VQQSTSGLVKTAYGSSILLTLDVQTTTIECPNTKCQRVVPQLLSGPSRGRWLWLWTLDKHGSPQTQVLWNTHPAIKKISTCSTSRHPSLAHAQYLSDPQVRPSLALTKMQTTRRLIVVLIGLLLLILLFKVLLHPSFLAVPAPYRSDLSDEEKKAAFDYQDQHEQPSNADDIVVPDADAAMKLAYGVG